MGSTFASSSGSVHPSGGGGDVTLPTRVHTALLPGTDSWAGAAVAAGPHLWHTRTQPQSHATPRDVGHRSVHLHRGVW